VVGFTDLPSRFGGQATNFYANNLVNLLEDMCAKGTLAERGAKKRPFFLPFPMFVPSLSWQNDRFYI
jgi:hypothetical protein